MNIHDACEEAYKRGYEKGRAEAIKEFADRVTAKADLIRVNDFECKWAISSDELDQIAKERGCGE